MDQLHSNTQHVKGKHLTLGERYLIQIRLKDGMNANQIAKELGCAPNTVRNEIRRGTVKLYNGRVARYKACRGQEVYENNRSSSCRNYDFLQKNAFIRYVCDHFFNDGWSLDACRGRAIATGAFDKSEVVCTKTLYNYAAQGLIGIKNIDLPEKLKRKPKRKHVNANKRKLGRSIDERDPTIKTRSEFGHWEFDLVLGSMGADEPALLTMLEIKTRNYLMIPIVGKTAEAVMTALEAVKDEFGKHFSDVFKTITADNGSEFATLSHLEEVSKTLVYYAHPYTACERGSNERHNGIIRRFIPKGKSISAYSLNQIAQIELWCNGLPRKILGYRTPEELFDEELDRIYAA